MRILLAAILACCFLPQANAQTSRGVVAIYSSGVTVVATTRQFTVYVGDIVPTTVSWAVNDIPGGNKVIGTVSSTGLYTAPPVAPAPNVVTVKAMSTVNPAKFGTAQVTVQQPTPWVWGVSPSPVLPGPINLSINGAGFVPGAVAWFGGVPLATTYVSATALTASGTATAAQVGSVNVTVANPDPGGVVSEAKAVTLQAAPLPRASVIVSPTPVSLALGSTQQFAAAVQNSPTTGLSWYVNDVAGGNAALGTVSANGLYRAPSVMPAATRVNVRAVLTASTSTFGYARVTLLVPATSAPVITAISPASIPVGSFSMIVTGSGFASGSTITWGGNPLATVYVSATQLTASGTATASQVGPIAVVVTNSNPGGASSAPFNVTVTGPSAVKVTISPPSANVTLGNTQSFFATVTGNANTEVAWSVNGVVGGNSAAGTVSSAGLYQSPSTLPNPSTVTVTATSAADHTQSASVNVTLASAAAPVSPAIISILPSPVPAGAFQLTINGTGFVRGAQVLFGGAALPTQFVSGTQLAASGAAAATQQGTNVGVVVTNPGNAASPQFNVAVAGGNSLVTSAVAARFLEQASFGPTPASVAHVQQVGLQGYLAEQFETPPSAWPDPNSDFSASGPMKVRFFTNAVNGPDQLRQRVAFALGQIFVISLNKLFYQGKMIPYLNLLANDAFGNYFTLMNDVTLSPAMGEFLDMVNNDKPNPALGTVANENYARELMQLFTIGTYMLNPDGTLQLDAQGNPIFTYDQNTITQFARVDTGWTYPTQPGNAPQMHNTMYYFGPMVAFDANHDTGSKTLLNGQALPAGQTAAKDMNDALLNIFNHPNVGPFVSKLLIQHLVMSNPSPAYVQRIASVFNNNGSGVRGDLQAVVTAILLDPEARLGDAPSASPATGGELREPVLFQAGLLRALGATVDDTNALTWDAYLLGEDIFNPPSVFNYFSPTYGIPGTNLLGPEFQLHTPSNAVGRANWVYDMIYSQWESNTQAYGIDLTSYVNLAGTPSQLVDAVDAALTGGQMPAPMKSYIINAVSGTQGNVDRAQAALYLTLTSSFYQVRH